MHCVPKKGGFTVVENEDNELIPTRLVTGWRVCIDYRKLNEATHKDHFPLPFIDQMLERLAGNQYYCFLDGFLVIFKFPSIRKIRRKPHSPAHTERLLIAACLLGYAMLQARFRGSDNDSNNASIHNEATNTQQQPNIQPQIITTVSNNNAKFPYLKKDDMKRTGRDHDGRVIILPPTTAEEHIAVQRESKARTTLLQSIPNDHVDDFHYMDDARDIWNAVKARFGEQQLAYEDLEQIEKLDMEEMDLKWQMAMLSPNGSRGWISAVYSRGRNKLLLRNWTLKRTDLVLEEPSSKRQKSTEASVPSVPDVPQSLVVSSPKSSGTRGGGTTFILSALANLWKIGLPYTSSEFMDAGDAGEFALIGVTSE
nr:reverse transcriptase domain-containing protein [Tanacetum cinerariifolium]